MAQRSNPWTTVTPLSKFIALILFIAMPFIGFWLGYQKGIESESYRHQAVVAPSKIETLHCGGNIKNPPTCPSGMECKLGSNPDIGGTCVYKND
jgi:hypothetical protein